MLRTTTALVLGALGLVIVIAAFEGGNGIARLFCERMSLAPSFADRGGTVGVMLVCTALVLGLPARPAGS